MEREDIYKLIDGERDYQEEMGKKYAWGEGKGAANHPVGEFLLMLQEYTRRAIVEWHQPKDGNEAALHMVRKVAGLAVACMEKHGAPPRKS